MNRIIHLSSLNFVKVTPTEHVFFPIYIVIITCSLFYNSVASSTFKDINGSLTSFPHNIPSNVTNIIIEQSNIPIIDYVEPFPFLRSFTFNDNDLTEFPDMTNVSSSLRNFQLMNNDICEIQFIPQLSRLDILDLSGNSLTEIPNLFNVNSMLSKLILSKK